jgi:small multidrug resistance pump
VNTFRRWFYAAAIYNFIWGTWVILFPLSFFRFLGMTEPNYPGIWQSVGMIVQVYALGYWLIARAPKRYACLVWVGLIGKTFGPIGFLFAALKGDLPWRFGLTILTNDLIWWPAFWMFALKHAVEPLKEAWRTESE